MTNETFVEGWKGVVTITNWVYQYLPQLITAITLLVLGFIFGKTTKWIINKLGKISNIDKISQGTDKIIHKIGYAGSTINFVGDMVKWVIYSIFIIASANVIFGQELLTRAFVSLTMYLPKVILSAIVIIAGLIFGDVIGNVVSNLIENSSLKLKEKNILAFVSSLVTKVLIVLAAFIIALDIVGLYVEVLTVIFAILSLAVMLFVLIGTKDLAVNIFAGIYLQSLSNFRKGMTIEFDGKRGVIKEVGLVYTTILYNKNEIQIPNYLFMKKSYVIR